MKLKFLKRSEWAVSHIFIWAGLVMISVWLMKYMGTPHARDAAGLLVGGIWALFGGFCWAAASVLQKFGRRGRE